MAHWTQCITEHVPIGGFHKHFNIPGNVYCFRHPGILEDRKHVFSCNLYMEHPESDDDGVFCPDKVQDFLVLNPMSFSFGNWSDGSALAHLMANLAISSGRGARPSHRARSPSWCADSDYGPEDFAPMAPPSSQAPSGRPGICSRIGWRSDGRQSDFHRPLPRPTEEAT